MSVHEVRALIEGAKRATGEITSRPIMLSLRMVIHAVHATIARSETACVWQALNLSPSHAFDPGAINVIANSAIRALPCCRRCGMSWCGTDHQSRRLSPEHDFSPEVRITFGSKECRTKGPRR